MSYMRIYIVMPAYNEGGRILPVLKELSKTKYTTIVVDDGSSDNTSNLIKKTKLKNVSLVTHKINLGKGGALKTGCDLAFRSGADAVIMMDSDGQHAVSDLSKFVEKLETNNYDVVFGSRNLGLGMPFIRFVGNKIASVLVNLLFGIYVSDLVSGYRAITKYAYSKVRWSHSRPPGYGVETEMIIRIKKANLKYCEIPIETIYFDEFKGVSVIDALGVFLNLIYWKFKL